MDDLVRAYFKGVHNCEVVEENFYHLNKTRYRVIGEAVDADTIKKTIKKNSEKAADPEMTSHKVKELHKRQNQEFRSMANEEAAVKTKGPRRTNLPLSRERNIGHKQDWEYDETNLDWGERHPEGQRLKSRAMTVVGTQRRQDKEAKLKEEVVDYLVSEGYAKDETSALGILEVMSDEWLESIVEAKVDSGLSIDQKQKARRERLASVHKVTGVDSPNSMEGERKYLHNVRRGRKKGNTDSAASLHLFPPGERGGSSVPGKYRGLQASKRQGPDPDLKTRASLAVIAQRRQDKETGLREDVIDYLISEGYAKDEESALGFLEAMSDKWLEEIIKSDQ
jgi:hypothetical protein